jgi:hypothetical protein
MNIDRIISIEFIQSISETGRRRWLNDESCAANQTGSLLVVKFIEGIEHCTSTMCHVFPFSIKFVRNLWFIIVIRMNTMTWDSLFCIVVVVVVIVVVIVACFYYYYFMTHLLTLSRFALEIDRTIDRSWSMMNVHHCRSKIIRWYTCVIETWQTRS